MSLIGGNSSTVKRGAGVRRRQAAGQRREARRLKKAWSAGT